MPPNKVKKPRKYYAVAVGRTRGIFATWEDTKASVDGFQGNVYKAFPTLEEAEVFLNKDHEPPGAFKPFTAMRKHRMPPPKVPKVAPLSQVPRSEPAPMATEGVEKTAQTSDLRPTGSHTDRQSGAGDTPCTGVGVPEAQTARGDADRARN